MPATVREICTLALKEAGVLGVGQTALAEDMNDAFTLFRRMVDAWQKQRWLVPNLTSVSFVLTGAKSYTIGPGGNFNYPLRPSQIKAGYIIQRNTGPTPVSMPMRQIFSYEDYANGIAVKDLQSLPYLFFYDNSYTGGLGNVFIWPVGSSQYEAHLIIQAQISFPTDLSTLDTTFNLPAEYEEAIHYNLCLRLRSMYQTAPTPVQIKLAKVGLNTLRKANIQVPTSGMPSGLTRGKSFNIYNADGY